MRLVALLLLAGCGGSSAHARYAVTHTEVMTSAPVVLTAACHDGDRAVAWQCATTPHGFYSLANQAPAATSDDAVMCSFAPSSDGERIGVWAGVACEP